MTNYMIGIDIGTTSTKSVLFTEQGEVITTSTQEYPLYTPAPDVAEQDPDEIMQAYHPICTRRDDPERSLG